MTSTAHGTPRAGGGTRAPRAAAHIPLTRDRAIEIAVALADREGADAVSMRRLAGELGVTPMALYKHVTDKDDLLRGMIDAVVAGYAPPRPGRTWREAVRARILSARQALLAHPWMRRLVETSTTRTPTVLAYMDSLAGDLLRGGLSADLTHHAMHALGHRIWGFSPEAFEDPDALALPDDPAERSAMLEHVRATYPHILAIALASTGGEATRRGCDEQSEFEFTLDLLLDAFERLHAAGWSSRR